MTLVHAGRAAIRLREHPRSDEIDPTARLVLIMMASFVGKGPRDRADPSCFASVANLAEATGYGESAVARAQRRLAELGLTERVGRTGRGLGHTVRWRLLLVRDDARTDVDPGEQPVRGTEEGEPVRGTEEEPVRGTEERPVRGTDNPSDLLATPGEREGEEDRPPLSRDASAGATAPAAAGSNGRGPGGIVGEVQEAFGYSPEAAERWIQGKVDAATSPVRNTTAYIRRCLAAEQETREARPRDAGKGGKTRERARQGAGTTRSARGSSSTKRPPVPPATQADRDQAVDDLRAGQPLQAVADRVGRRPDTVKQWHRDRDYADALAAVRGGDSVEAALEKWPAARSHAYLLRNNAERVAQGRQEAS